jgi:hypothetical protein
MIVSGCSESVSTREPPARSTTGDTGLTSPFSGP